MDELLTVINKVEGDCGFLEFYFLGISDNKCVLTIDSGLHNLVSIYKNMTMTEAVNWCHRAAGLSSVSLWSNTKDGPSFNEGIIVVYSDTEYFIFFICLKNGDKIVQVMKEGSQLLSAKRLAELPNNLNDKLKEISDFIIENNRLFYVVGSFYD